jgi:hypothetical protein
MTVLLQEVENKAFTLSLPERGQLIHDLIINIDGESIFRRFRDGDSEKNQEDQVRKSSRNTCQRCIFQD